MDDAQTNSFVACTGRTSGGASKLRVSDVYVRDDGSLFIRIDDELNLPAWIEVVIQPEAIKKKE